MVSDYKSDTTSQLQIRHNRHNRCHGSLSSSASVAQNGQRAVSPGQRPGYRVTVKYAQKGQKHCYVLITLLPIL